jgi:ubiquinone/menaquinone biosynthesis C-methylase UbiE
MASNAYKKQSTLHMYYTMHYAPFLKNGTAACLTEPYYQAMLHLIAPYVQAHMNVLDMGCALGRMSFELAKQTPGNAVGIDTSQEFITACHEIAANQNESVAYPVPPQAKVSFLIADAQELPFTEQVFQCVLCLNLIDRVAHPKNVIAEITRVLSPTGLLLISNPYDWEEEHTAPSEWMADMRDLFSHTAWETVLEKDRVPFTIQVYDRKISTYANHTLLLRKR